MKKRFVLLILFYLRLFARLSLAINKPLVVGITGSAGKSSARNIIYAILKDHAEVKVIEKGNSETGIPLGILGLKVNSLGFTSVGQAAKDWIQLLAKAPFRIFYLSGVDYLIVEMGIDEPDSPKNMEYLLSIIKPDVSVILNVFPVHAMQFGSVATDMRVSVEDAIASEKAKIITKNNRCRIAVINNDSDPILKALSGNKKGIANKPVQTFTFGASDTNTISYGPYALNLQGSQFTFRYRDTKIQVNLSDYVLPKAYQETIAAGILTGIALKIPVDEIVNSLEQHFSLPEGRSTILKGIRDSVIIDSTYNASTAPTLSHLEAAILLKKVSKRPLVFVFGDMRELGDETKAEHEKIATRLLRGVKDSSGSTDSLGVDELVCVGPLTKEFVVPLVEGAVKTKWFENAQAVGKYLQKELPNKAIVLVKGSQNTIFLEEAIKYILDDPKDVAKLCRQEEYWMEIKKIN